MCVTDVFSIIKDIVISIAAATTAIVAYKGLEKWHKELKGKANFDVALSLIKSTYKLRDKIESCRSPFIPANEFPKDYDPNNKTDILFPNTTQSQDSGILSKKIHFSVTTLLF